jgi:ribosomal protein S19
MGRSIKKGPFVEDHLLAKIQKAKLANQKTPIKTWSRRSTITPEFVGLTFTVHNGKVFNSGVHHRKHGGPQAGRVFADAHVQETRRPHGQGGG